MIMINIPTATIRDFICFAKYLQLFQVVWAGYRCCRAYDDPSSQSVIPLEQSQPPPTRRPFPDPAVSEYKKWYDDYGNLVLNGLHPMPHHMLESWVKS